ncbi:hypothetical protein Dvina_13580 [Dactylosporangium vinaceum]|uniref:Uncharacterized protein n=1 Tax=Dactylosporangium vinaceum TaxID=53362 RepID=A0ABV5MGB0_9ACTN|nr:hypothetical protein [Dactylosporangium vinaceum]UAB99013.1 hypothetical protein Dvina_13580 [Dactylosporangium vinaceum]
MRLWRRTAATAHKTGSATADRGGIAVSGVAVFGTSTPVRSHYLAQVQLIAPEQLEGRDRELAAMAAFGTAEDPAPAYQWWRAPAWAGKSALAAWFVLNPPKGLRIVSFFVTARYADQHDRAAFVDVVLEQLAQLTNQPLPTLLSAGTKHAHFLGMLEEAVAHCHRRGERLLLLVDGLDEDRGVTVGPDAHSIAAMLPPKPPLGLRVLVLGRPHPPVPDDVPDDHPLRSPANIRQLAIAPAAVVVRQDAERELTRLLAATTAERDLLGLLTVCGGGLTTSDLSELTGRPQREISRQLKVVSGRSFRNRVGRWQPDIELYLLAHEELQRRAVEEIGKQRLDDYRLRLHAWADGYRDNDWPSGTPEYLLSEYFGLLHGTGDTKRMMALVTDRIRHDRMLDIIGGDSVALTELSLAEQTMAELDPPDLSAVGRLQLHRDRLLNRNLNAPIGLPAVWAKLCKPARGEALARSMDAGNRVQALAGLVHPVFASGDHQRSHALIDEAAEELTAISGLDQIRPLAALVEAAVAIGEVDWAAMQAGRAETVLSAAPPSGSDFAVIDALTEVVRAKAAVGDLQRAEFIASVIDDDQRDQARFHLLIAEAKAGDRRRVERLLDEMQSPYWQARSLIALMWVPTGPGMDIAEPVEAIGALLDSVSDLRSVIAALTALVRAMAAVTDSDVRFALTVAVSTIEFTDPQGTAVPLWAMAEAALASRADDPIGLLAAEAQALIRTVLDPEDQAEPLTALAGTLADIGRFDGAAELAVQIEALMRHAIAEEHGNIEADLTALTAALIATGDTRRASVVAARAEEVIAGMEYPYFRARAFTELGRVLAAGDRPAEAASLLGKAEANAELVTNQYLQSRFLTGLAAAVAAGGDLGRARALADEAEVLARALARPELLSRALSGLAWVATLTEDLDRAEALAAEVESLTGAGSGDDWTEESLPELAELVTSDGTWQYSDSDAEESRSTTLLAALGAGPDETAHENSPSSEAWLDRVISEIKAIAESLDPARTRSLARETMRHIGSGTDPRARDILLAGLAGAVAFAGDRRLAVEIATGLQHPEAAGRAWPIIVTTAADASEHDLARSAALELLRTAGWRKHLVTISQVDPQLPAAIADEYLLAIDHTT